MRSHLEESNAVPTLRQLPSGFATREAAPENVDEGAGQAP
jgi:hypothetical protein